MLSQAEKYTVSEDSSLIDFLAAQYPQSSKTGIKKMIVHGSVEVQWENRQESCYEGD